RCAINFHDSVLPAYAGLNATSWAIMAGETRHGISWHEMTAEIDGGRILRQQSFALTPDDTAFTANAKCYEAAAESFEALIEDLLASVTRYNRHAASFEAWWSREFERLAPTVLPYPRHTRPGESQGNASLPAILAAAAAGSPKPEHVAAAFVGWVAGLTGAST